MSNQIETLQEKHGIDGAARFSAGQNSLVHLTISSGHGDAEIYLHGAHVTSWKPKGEIEALFMSRSSAFAAGKPIRGGVPICFPWFGARAEDAAAPAHGFARLREFEVESVQQQGDAVIATLRLDSDAETKKWWNADFTLRQIVTLGRELTMELQVENRGKEAISFEEALHTYFAVSDAKQVRVEGLQGATYLSKVEQQDNKLQSDQFIVFERETDRVYADTNHACIIHDDKGGRRVKVEKTGSLTTVVWNPWIDKAKRMEDFDDDRWPEMVCVETANTAKNRVSVNPGQRRSMTAKLTIQH